MAHKERAFNDTKFPKRRIERAQGNVLRNILKRKKGEISDEEFIIGEIKEKDRFYFPNFLRVIDII